MKTCKKGLHQYEPVKGSKIGCPECRKAVYRKWRDDNKDKARLASREWARRNMHSIREWEKNNPEKCREIGLRHAKQQSATLSDVYVAHQIRRALNIPYVTPELIEAKRAQLKLKRLIKDMQK